MSTEVIGKISTTTDITSQFIDDVLCTAFESGISYWATNVRPLGNVWPDNAEYVSECLTRGVDIVITEDSDNSGHVLTMQKMLMGIERFCNRNNRGIGDLIEDHDAEDADCIVQYAIFGEIVYG